MSILLLGAVLFVGLGLAMLLLLKSDKGSAAGSTSTIKEFLDKRRPP
jgi:preprotein translocase subunit SecG